MFEEGKRVRIFLDDTSLKLFGNPLKKYHDKVYTIAKAIYHRNGQTTSYTYTLVGVQSRHGIPYEFLEEWLIPYDIEVME